MLKNIPHFKTKQIFSQKFVFPSTVIKWNSLEHNIWKVRIFSVFKNNILKFIRPTCNSIFNCENHRGIKLITRLCVGLNQLSEHKFKHSVQDALNLIYSCSFDVESMSLYILYCPMYNEERHDLLSTIKNTDYRLLSFGNCSVDVILPSK